MSGPGVSLIVRTLLCASCLFVLIACGKEEAPKTEVGGKTSVIRLDALLDHASTKLIGGIQINAVNFEPYQGNGWEVRKDLISAVNKRTVLILPELPITVSRALLKFRMNLPEDATARRLLIQSKEKELAALNLKKGSHEYQVVLKPEEWKRLRFVFDGRKSASQSFGDFAGFELQFYGRSSFKIKNEVRPSIVVPANTTILFSVPVPAVKPYLSVGAAIHGDAKEQLLSVLLQQGSSTNKLLDFRVSSTEWSDHQIDLSRFAGKTIQLGLKSSNQLEPDALAVWSNPEIFDASVKREGPNIILFSVDALRPDHLSHYGYSIKTSPNMDAFARESTVFSRAYCTSPSTLPSHASVMTGLYVSQHHVGKKTRMMSRLQRIPEGLTTLAELASQQNYRTAAITDDGYVSSFYGFQQGFQQYMENNDVEKNEVVATIDDGIEWVKKNHTRPFFLFLHSYEVHEPFTPPLSAFQHLFPDHKLKDGKSPEIYNEWLKNVMTGKIVPTPEEKDLVRKAFDAEIYFFDQQFGRFWKELQKLQLDKNTIVIVFSDHGQQFFDRGNDFGHANSLFVEEIQVPLIIRMPGRRPQQIHDPVSLIDIYPTVAGLLGAKNPPPGDGLDLLQTPGKKKENRAIYYEIHDAEKALWGIQNHEYKLLVDSEHGQSFFDIRKDPRETSNLNSLSPRAMNSMKNLLSSYISQSMAPPKHGETVAEREEAAELNERLRALGYLN